MLLLIFSFTAVPLLVTQQPSPPIPPAAPPMPNLPPPPVGHSSVQPAFVVVIDAAHGGADTGAQLSDSLLEKNVTLDFSSRLRSVLAARGIYVISTRTSDTDMPAKSRAGVANHSLPAACLIVHATATGSGVHLFTSSLAPANASGSSTSSGFLPWQTAQAAWMTRSLRLSAEINSALGQAGIPVTLGGAAIEPLDSVTCPAVAIEVAPLAASPAGKAEAITDPGYQQRILDALAAAMLEWNTDWKQQP